MSDPTPDRGPDDEGTPPTQPEPPVDIEAQPEPEPRHGQPSEPGPEELASSTLDALPGSLDETATEERLRHQNRLAALGLAVVLVLLAFGAGFAIGRASAPARTVALVPAATPGASPAPGSSAGASGDASPSSLPSDGPRLGQADAPVTIEYWADFQCPYCARFAQDVIPQLTSRIAAGTVALVHRDFAFIGSESIDAAVAVRCAGRQGYYWPMHDAVYAAQQGENQGAFARDRLESIAASVGVDAATFTACLDEREPLVEVLDDTSAGVRAGIQSTPTIDVNGTRFLGVPDMSQFLAAIDGAAAGASPGVLPTPAPTNDPWATLRTSGREAGDPSAPVTVELWMDYQAAASATVVNELEPELQTRIATGAIRVEQRDLALLGDESVVAAATVRCVAAQDGPTWFAHDVLSGAGQGAGSGIFTTVNVLRFASRLGLDVSAISACLDDATITDAVRTETAQGSAMGLTTAPAVVVKVGGSEVARFEGDLDVSAILKAIDAAG